MHTNTQEINILIDRAGLRHTTSKKMFTNSFMTFNVTHKVQSKQKHKNKYEKQQIQLVLYIVTFYLVTRR